MTKYLLQHDYTGMINIIDASQLKRNLQLTIQLLELNVPMMIGLNMIDVSAKRGIMIDHDKLMRRLRVPVLPVIARNGKGTAHMLEELQYLDQAHVPHFKLNYGTEVEKAIKAICTCLKHSTHYTSQQMRFIAIQYLLDNAQICQTLNQTLIQQLEPIKSELSQQLTLSIRDDIEQKRNHYIEQILTDVVTYPDEEKQFFSSKLDKILINKYIGMPIFLGIMWLIFQITFTWIGTPLSDQLDGFIGGTLTDWVKSGMHQIGVVPFYKI